MAVAALEPHFAQRLCEAAGVALCHPVKDMFKPEVHQALAAWLGGMSRRRLDSLARRQDIPLHTLA